MTMMISSITRNATARRRHYSVLSSRWWWNSNNRNSSSTSIDSGRSTTTTTANKDERPAKRKRKKKSLSPSSSKFCTTKDRMRRVVEYNQIDGKNISMLFDPRRLNQILGVAQGRMSYIRNQLFTYWNPDYNTTRTNTSNQSRLGNTRQQQRPSPSTTVIRMDARWWMYNILFALLPAIIIGAYCEFRGRHLMRDFHVKQELEQMERIIGTTNTNTNEEVYDQQLQQHEQLELSTNNNNNNSTDDDNFFARFRHACNEIIEFFFVNISSAPEAENVQENDEGPPTASSNSAASASSETNERDKDQGSISKPTLINLQQQQQQKQPPAVVPTISTTTSSRSSSKHNNNKNKEPSPSISVEDLIDRIQKLESALEGKNLLLKEEENVTTTEHQQKNNDQKEKNRKLQYELERATKQSGIQNRMEDELIKKWEKQKQQQQQNDDGGKGAWSSLLLPPPLLSNNNNNNNESWYLRAKETLHRLINTNRESSPPAPASSASTSFATDSNENETQTPKKAVLIPCNDVRRVGISNISRQLPTSTQTTAILIAEEEKEEKKQTDGEDDQKKNEKKKYWWWPRG